MKNLFLILALLFSGIGYAQTKNNSESNLDGLCAAVSTAQEEVGSSPNIYTYQTKILSAARVSSSDTEDEVKKKVQIFWKKNEEKLICDALDFNVPKGSIVKLAVARRFEDFIDDVTVTWNVDLNKVDKFDNKTVLDYIQYEMEIRKGTPHEPVLQRYYCKSSAKSRHFIKETKGVFS